jgi:hypothetical protein
MNKREQLKDSLRKRGLSLDGFSGGEELTSKLLAQIRGGMDPRGCTTKGDNHDKQHSKWEVRIPIGTAGHSKCIHPKK